MKRKDVVSVRARTARPEHPLAWLTEPLEEDASFVNKAWFGGRSLMLDGRHQLVLTCQGEPWQGVLVCTSHEHQESLQTEIPSLVRHPVLGKWLYLPESAESFESDARRLVSLARTRDPRLGVLPRPRKKKIRKVRFGGEP